MITGSRQADAIIASRVPCCSTGSKYEHLKNTLVGKQRKQHSGTFILPEQRFVQQALEIVSSSKFIEYYASLCVSLRFTGHILAWTVFASGHVLAVQWLVRLQQPAPLALPDCFGRTPCTLSLQPDPPGISQAVRIHGAAP